MRYEWAPGQPLISLAAVVPAWLLHRRANTFPVQQYGPVGEHWIPRQGWRQHCHWHLFPSTYLRVLLDLGPRWLLRRAWVCRLCLSFQVTSVESHGYNYRRSELSYLVNW